MGVIRNGRAATIREFVKAHPSCTWGEIMEGLHAVGNWRELGREVTRMVRDGRLVAERPDGSRLHYLPGREPPPPRSAKPKPTHYQRRLQAAELSTKPAPKKPEPPRCQTVDEFLANGGQVERLSVHWEPYRHYPRVGRG